MMWPSRRCVWPDFHATKRAYAAVARAIELVFIGEAFDARPDDERFCRSYVNFYFTNGGLVMPRYGTATDRAAYEVLRGLFPDRRIVQVPIDEIATGGGGIHCITQQHPAVRDRV